jgi:methionyl-tRNA formyltransferase
MIKKADGLLDFALPAVSLERQVRAFNPWPGAFTTWKNQILKIHQTYVINETTGVPGQQLIRDDLPAISTVKGILVLEELQPAGKNIMNGKSFLLGARNWGT